jgi:diguanylate cyclase (GGDEF)-like protein/putative nucleotidyltransferase with HDIG domain
MNGFGFIQDYWRAKVIALSAIGVIALIGGLMLFKVSAASIVGLGLLALPMLIVANLVHKSHLRTLEQKTHQITEASRIHLATVEALATAIDARDQVGIGHARRTQIFAVGIGRLLGLPEHDINALCTGALLHDIGKLAVPDHILNKPGRLTPAEVEKTKTHASVGASILEKVGFPYPVVPTVKYHHEAWDGSGYPEGLRGSNIPLTARILSVADAYDTLRGDRPYRGAVSREDACRHLRAAAGTQLDPGLVDLFLRNLLAFEEEIAAQDLAYENDGRGTTEIANSTGIENSGYVEQIKRANREVFTLYSLAREFSGALNLQQTLSLFTEKVREFVPFDTCLIYLMDDSGEFASAAYAAGKHASALEGRRMRIGEGATGYVLKKAKPVQNVDPSVDLAYLHTDIASGYKAMASIPMMASEKVIGAVSIYSMELAGYQDEHLRLLETVSRIAADAITKSLHHAETETIALTDPMTGLPNARSLQMQFDREVKRASRSGTNFQLLVLDLDGFKAVNDTHGHKAGDKMLKEIANVIRGQLREYDFLARYGGDEFVAIVPEIDNEGVTELSHRIEEAVDEFVLPVGEDQFAKVGVSLGAAAYPTYGETFDQIVIAADKAMYLTKAGHKKKAASQNGEVAQAMTAAASASRWDPKEAGIIQEFRNEDKPVEVEVDDALVVELDESNIVSSTAIN